jgi:hypothetical protein
MPLRPFSQGNVARAAFAPPPAYVDVRVLAANAAERHAVPQGAKKVIFSGNADFFAKFGDGTVTAALPAADVLDGSGSELNPEAREIPSDCTHISLVSASATIVSLSFYGE